jgi:hypothetical protein
MMGHREKMKGGDEYDCFGAWRKWVHIKSHEVKTLFSRRIRRAQKQRLHVEKKDFPTGGSAGPP